MANLKISELTVAGALAGTELVEVVQGGVNKQTTTQDIADLGGGAVDSVNGQTGVVVLDAGDIANTPAGNISATTVQAAINELDSETASGRAATDTTGTAISFAVPQFYGSSGSPETGNVTLITTGMVKGMMQVLFHNSGSEPTWPSEFVRKSGEYIPGSLNTIYMLAISTTQVHYTICQDI